MQDVGNGRSMKAVGREGGRRDQAEHRDKWCNPALVGHHYLSSNVGLMKVRFAAQQILGS